MDRTDVVNLAPPKAHVLATFILLGEPPTPSSIRGSMLPRPRNLALLTTALSVTVSVVLWGRLVSILVLMQVLTKRQMTPGGQKLATMLTSCLLIHSIPLKAPRNVLMLLCVVVLPSVMLSQLQLMAASAPGTTWVICYLRLSFRLSPVTAQLVMTETIAAPVGLKCCVIEVVMLVILLRGCIVTIMTLVLGVLAGDVALAPHADVRHLVCLCETLLI